MNTIFVIYTDKLNGDSPSLSTAYKKEEDAKACYKRLVKNNPYNCYYIYEIPLN